MWNALGAEHAESYGDKGLAELWVSISTSSNCWEIKIDICLKHLNSLNERMQNSTCLCTLMKREKVALGSVVYLM